MKQGALIFDERSDRYDIRFDLADYYGGLHCGETFDVMVGGRWKPTRIEYGANWYLVGIRADDLSGLRVRIKVCDLVMEYKKGVKVLNHVNLTIEHGIYGLLGENGAGKTTLIPRRRPAKGSSRHSSCSTHASASGPCDIEGNSFSVCS